MKLLSLILLGVFFVSCGESPIWNHNLEKSGLSNDIFANRAETYQFAKTKFNFSIDWIVGPIKGENKFVLKSWNKDLGTLNGPYQDLPNELKVYLWMPDMGHGSAPVKIKKLNKGEYEISSAYFIMGGRWEIYFQLLKSKDEVLDEVVLPINL